MKRFPTACVIFMAAILVTQMFGVAMAHDAANFTAFRYRVVEGNKEESVIVRRGTHGVGVSSVGVAVTAGSASDGLDFDASDVRIEFTEPVQDRETPVAILDDVEEEPLESIALDLHDPSRGMVIAFPNRSEMTIIDDDGASRLQVESPALSVFETSKAVDVWVIRSGAVSESASVSFSTEDGTASSGSDYVATSGTIGFSVGQRVQKISVPLKDNDLPDGNRDFSVSLSAASGALLTETSIASVTIQDNESDGSGDQVAPYTAFHKPLDGKTYNSKNFKEIFVFMQDNQGGAGMETVRLAIRKKKADGSCAWLRPVGFQRGACKEIKWSGQTPDLYTDLAYFRLREPLEPSNRGQKVRRYTAFSQGVDRVGNVQTIMDKGQNRNDFEVKPG
jgi:hypothetical protein